MYEFYDLDSRALVTNDMTLVHDFVLYVTGYETAVLLSAALAGCVRQENLEGQHKAVFKASVESEQTKLGAGVNEDAEWRRRIDQPGPRQEGISQDCQQHHALSGSVPADCRNLHRRSLGKRFVGKILGMGSEGGMGSDHHAHLFSRHSSGIIEMVPQPEELSYLRLPERPRYIFRRKFPAWRAAQLCIIPNAIIFSRIKQYPFEIG